MKIYCPKVRFGRSGDKDSEFSEGDRKEVFDR